MQTFKSKKYINCKGKLANTDNLLVMGILNITQDSFFDGGKYNDLDAALFRVENMLNQGCTFIDVGAQSTRPGAEMIGENEEIKIAIPILEKIIEKFPEALVSVDTFSAKVAEHSILVGASMINDVSAGNDDPKMFETIIKYKVPYVMMHKKGSSKNMQINPTYENIMLDLIDYFTPKVEFLRKNGVSDIILDPGFGFGKTLAHNYEILNHLEDLKIFELPILAGISRKKMIQSTVNQDAENSLNGTTAANTIALMKGAHILRVHDVKEAVECIKIYKNTIQN